MRAKFTNQFLVLVRRRSAAVGWLCLGIWLAGMGCASSAKKIPQQFRGVYWFDSEATVAEWEGKSHWPKEVKERLKGMALPTQLRIDAAQLVVTDLASAQSVTQRVNQVRVRGAQLELMLFSNFARTNQVTTLRFDGAGFWLEEGTLFPDYRERFRKSPAR